MKNYILSAVFISMVIAVNAQYFETGQDPASIRWRQLHTRNFQLIYPDYYEKNAQILASYLENVYPYGSYSLGHNPGKMPVILHTQTIKSNGLVAWAPKRSEYYTTPHQDIYPQDWLKQLSLHEFRHIVQVDKVNSHLPGILKFVFGEQITALAFGGYLPWWLIEGDAVVMETALSNYGRGRFPSFLMEHKAQLVEKGVYSYDKAYLGSYKDFVPNHYKLGYYLVGNARERYGTRLWKDVLTNTGEKPLSVNPVNRVLKGITGFNKAGLYRSVFDSLQNIWTEEDKSFNPDSYDVITANQDVYTTYEYNHWLNDSEIITLRTSFKKIPAFVRIKQDGSEKKIIIPGTVFNESADYHHDWIIWSEQIPDPRWQHSGKSLIRIFNTETREKIEINTEHKSFSPVISPDGQSVITVEADFSSNYYLSVYTIPGGELLTRFQTPDNNYFVSPRWLNDNTVAVILITDKGKKIARVDLDSEETEILIGNGMGDIRQLRVKDKYLYFISSYSGKNSLYRLNLNDLSVVRIYEPRFGVESPAVSPDGSKILLSDYTSDGSRLIQIKADNEGIIPIDRVNKGEYPLAEKMAAQELGIPVLQGKLDKNYPSSPYSKASNHFNFHSRAPLYIDAADYEISPGATLMSQNKLGTAVTTLGYKWDLSEKTGRILMNYSFKGWYPVFDLDLSYGNRASEYKLINQITNNQGEIIRNDTTVKRFLWKETSAGANIKLPLDLTKGAYYRLLQTEINYDLNHYKHHSSTPSTFPGGSFHTMSYRIYFYQLMRQSYQDMYPDFGFITDGSFRHLLTSEKDKNYLAAIQTNLFLPGFMKNHGIKIYAGFQKKEIYRQPGFSDVVRFARGWGQTGNKSINTLGIDYKMPLLYPDLNLSGLLYLQRISTSLFWDYTRFSGDIFEEGKKTGYFISDISSLGAEITANVNYLRFYAPSNIGFRASYLPEAGEYIFQLLFSIDFTSL